MIILLNKFKKSQTSIQFSLLAFTVCIMIGLLSYAVTAQVSTEIIDGDVVYIDDDYVRLEAYPHTMSGSGYVTFNATSKLFTGDVDFIWGFDSSKAVPKTAELYKVHDVTEQKSYTCDEPYWYNYTLSPNYLWCWNNITEYIYDNVTNESTEIIKSILIFEHDFETANVSTKTIYWTETHSENYVDVHDAFNKVEFDYGGMDTWYYTKNVNVIAGHEYSLKSWIEIPFNTNGKYWFCVKPSSLSIQDAHTQNKLYCLDPWWNATFEKKKEIQIDNNDLEVANYSLLLNVSYDSDMNNDFSDIRFVNGSEDTSLSYWIENKVDGLYADVWVKIPYTLTNTTNTTIYMYYDNTSVVSSESDFMDAYSYTDNFDDDDYTSNPVWTVESGTWVVDTKTLRGGSVGSSYEYIYSNIGSTIDVIDIDVQFKFSSLSAAGNSVSIYLMKDIAVGYVLYIQQGGGYDLWSGDFAAKPIAGSWTPDTDWHTARITRDKTSELKIYLDGVEKGVVTDTTMTAFNKIRFRRGNTANFYTYYDNISINHFITTPTYSFGAEETSSDTTNPTVSWNYPSDDSWNTSRAFNVGFTPHDETQLDNCTLRDNRSGTMTDTVTNTSVLVDNSVNTITETFTSDGHYNISIKCWDTSSNYAETVGRLIKVDSIAPSSISISSPTNGTIVNAPTITGTWTDTNKDTCYTNASEYSGVSSAFSFTNTSYLADGRHDILVTCNDSAGNTGSNIVYFTQDATKPTITISSPTNDTYATDSIWFNVTLDEVGSWCGYSLDSATNVTMTNSSGNWNTQNSSMTEGSHTVIFTCNDTASNINTKTEYFTIDTISPVISLDFPTQNDTHLSYVPYFNGTCIDTNLDKIWTNATEYSTIDSSTPFNFTNTSALTEQRHDINITCNDTAGNQNSALFWFTYDPTSPSVSNLNWQTTSGETSSSLNYNQVLDWIKVDASDTNLVNVTLSIQKPDDTYLLSNTTLSLLSGSTYQYTTDITLSSNGTWTITAYSMDNASNIGTSSSTIDVTIQAVSVADGFFGYDTETIPNTSSIADLTGTYDFTTIGIYDNFSNIATNWSSIQTAINDSKNQNVRVMLRHYFDGDYSDSNYVYNVKNNITTYYTDLKDSPYYEGTSFIVMTLNTSNSNPLQTDFTNNVSESIVNATGNKFKVYVQTLDNASLDSAYVSTWTMNYNTYANNVTFIDDEALFLRHNTSKTRLYYNLSNDMKYAVSNYNINILQKMRGNPVGTGLLDYSNVAELNTVKYDVVVFNNQSTEQTYTINVSSATRTNKDAWDYVTRRLIEKDTDGNFSVTVQAYYASMILFEDLDHISYSETTSILYSTDTSEETYTNYTTTPAGAMSSWNYVPTNHDMKLEVWDGSYLHNNTFYHTYEWLNATKITDWSGYDYIVISDDNLGELDYLQLATPDIRTKMFGYVNVADFADTDEWETSKKSEAWVWTDVYGINVFVDGLDTGVMGNGFETRLKSITDSIRVDKNKLVILNDYTSYQDVSNYGDIDMKESWCGRWDDAVGNPTYTYETLSVDKNRATWAKTNPHPQLAMTFGDVNDVEKMTYCYAMYLVLLGNANNNSYRYAQPNFQGQREIRVKQVGSQLESTWTETSSTDWNRKFTNGVMHIDPIGHTWWFDDGRTIDSAQLCFELYNGASTPQSNPGIDIRINNWTAEYHITYDMVAGGVSYTWGWACVNVTDTNHLNDLKYGRWNVYTFAHDRSEPNSLFSLRNEKCNGTGVHSWYDDSSNNTDVTGIDELNPYASWVEYGRSVANNDTEVINWHISLNIEATSKVGVDTFTTGNLITKSINTATGKTNVTYSATHEYNMTVWDNGTYVDNYISLSAWNDTGFVTLTPTETSTCDTDNPTWGTDTIAGYTWGSCYETIASQVYVRVSIPHLSAQTFQINTDNPPTVVWNYPSADTTNDSRTFEVGFTPQDDFGFMNCTLRDNRSSAMADTASNTSVIVNASVNTIAETFTSDGHYNISIKCTDTSSLTAESAGRTIIVDTTPPTITLASPANTSYDTTSIDLNWSADETLFTAEYSLNGEANISLLLKNVGQIANVGVGVDVWGDGTYTYLANRDDGLRAYTFDGTTFTNVGHIDSGGSGKGVWEDGTYTYLANEDDGLRAYTFNGATFTNVGHIDNGGMGRGVWGDGTYIYLANRDDGLRAYTFNGATFTNVGHIDNGGLGRKVWGDGTYIYLANYDGGLRAYTFNGTDFTNVGHIDNGGWAYDVWGDGTYIYLANNDDGLRAYTFDGTTFTNVGHIDNGGNGYGVWGDGTYIYLGNYDDGLRAYTFSGSTFTNVGHIDNIGAGQGVWGDGTYTYLASSSYGIRAYTANFENITITAVEGQNNITIWADDPSLNMNSTTTYFTVDTTPPVITIQSPTNTSYTNQTIWFNITANENLDWCGYSLNSASNITMTNSTGNWNANNATMADATHTVQFHCNDTVGNMNDTTVIFTFDSTKPIISFTSTTPADGSTHTTSSSVTIEVTLTELHPNTCILDWAGTNYSMTRTGSTCTKTMNDLINIQYEYYVWADDVAGNSNTTANQTVTILYHASTPTPPGAGGAGSTPAPSTKNASITMYETVNPVIIDGQTTLKCAYMHDGAYIYKADVNFTVNDIIYPAIKSQDGIYTMSIVMDEAGYFNWVCVASKEGYNTVTKSRIIEVMDMTSAVEYLNTLAEKVSQNYTTNETVNLNDTILDETRPAMVSVTGEVMLAEAEAHDNLIVFIFVAILLYVVASPKSGSKSSGKQND